MNKVAIISPTHNVYGGGQIYLENLFEGLKQKKLEVNIYSSDAVFSKSLKIKKLSSWLDKFVNIVPILAQLKRDNVDVVILNDINISMLSVLFKFSGFKVYSLIHMEMAYSPKLKTSSVASKFLGFARGLLVSAGSYSVFNINKQNSKFLLSGKEVFLGNMLPKAFESAPFFDCRRKQFDLGYIGRLSKEKNINGLLFFLNFFCKKNPEASVIIVGEGELSSFVENFINDNNLKSQVYISGFKKHDELKEIYSRIKLNLIFSHTEGFPTTILESAAFNVPSLAPSIGSCSFLAGKYPEVISTFSHSYSQEKIADLVKRMIEKEREDICFEVFLADFTISNISEVVYREINS
ncbi:glycosyltransferase family 4 protein [Vibrio harveyi]